MSWKRWAAIGLASMLPAMTALAQTAPPPGQAPRGNNPPPPVPSQNQPRQNTVGHQPGQQDVVAGPIDNPQDILETAKLVFKLADSNNDNQISQKEATDAGNLLVGGFFFRADQNGDGTLTKDEAQQARDALFQQQPLLRFLVQRTDRSLNQGGDTPNTGNQNQPKPNQGDATDTKDVARVVGALLDANNDRQLQATELRQAVQTAVQTIFAVMDSDRNNNLTPAEINQGVYNIARETVVGSFQLADGDKNGSLSKDEFKSALTEPANVAFDILDRNFDGQLTTQELEQAMRIVMGQIKSLEVPTPANSPANVLGSQGTVNPPDSSSR